MTRVRTLLAGVLAAGLLAGAPASALAHGIMGQGQGPGMMMEPGYDMHRGRGMMTEPGYGMRHGPGTMMGRGHGMHHGTMMGQGHGMHPGMMMGRGHGMHHGMMMGHGMMTGPGLGIGPRMLYGWPSGEDRDLSAADVRAWLERKLAWHGNPRLKLGAVAEADDDIVVAEIVTQDGSLVQKLAIDRHSGVMRQVD